jgi:hypothetical protein
MTDMSRGEVSATQDSAVAWAAVIAGAVSAAALTLVLLAFGAGMGFSSISPWPNSGISAGTFKLASGIYLIVIAMLSSTIGGYIAGRLRTKWTGLHSEEVLFRDTAHGFLAWGLATVFGAAVLASAATFIAGGATAGAAQGASQGAAQSGGGLGGPDAYFVDLLLRPQPGGTATPAPGTAQNIDTAQLRAEITRVFVRGLREGGEIPAGDRSYLTQVVSARTGMSQPDAEKRVSEVIEQARSAADQARSGAAKLSLWLTAAMLIGAFSASLAAIEGGQLRDGTWKGVIGTSQYPQRTVS